MSIRSNMGVRRLDQRVTFQRNNGVQDASGDTPENWQNIVPNVQAAVDGEKGREAALGGGIKGESVYTVWVHADIVYRFSITVRDRILWGARILNIADIPDQQLRGRMLAMICRSGVNAG